MTDILSLMPDVRDENSPRSVEELDALITQFIPYVREALEKRLNLEELRRLLTSAPEDAREDIPAALRPSAAGLLCTDHYHDCRAKGWLPLATGALFFRSFFVDFFRNMDGTMNCELSAELAEALPGWLNQAHALVHHGIDPEGFRSDANAVVAEPTEEVAHG